jgi:hypothetical protein
MATGYRAPDVWQPRLVALRARLQQAKQTEGTQRALDAIQAVIGRWSNLAKK